MSKGLKQMVAEATAKQDEAPAPVQVSGDAVRELSRKMREWSGWSNSRTVIGDPTRFGSPFASCDHETRTFIVNPDRLVLNPNRVLLTVTPFRMRQEAVLTGSLLHEAGHARHSHWQPSRYGNPAVLLHSDGTKATAQTVAVARLMEEPRVEGLMARDANDIGAATLEWTMRASAAHLVPMTKMSADPGQQIMDLITSWALRAGRQYALAHWTNHRLRGWVQEFTTLLHGAIEAHLTDRQDKGADCDPAMDTRAIVGWLIVMTTATDDIGPTMIDAARKVLDLLFPETDEDEDEDNQPMPGAGCSDDETSDEEQETQPGEAKDDESDESEGEESEGDESEGEEAAESEGDESDEGDEGDESEGGGDGSESEGGEPNEADESGSGGASGSTDDNSELAKALAEMENQAKHETEDEVDETADAAEDEAASGGGAGSGGGESHGGGWRNPNKTERGIQKGAERFLRNLIDASESSKVSLTDTPSSTVDGGALAAWKAGGQHNAPNFFVRTRREVQPSPPVQVAILVDVSSSMGELQKPSAVLSWALAAAALDLRNFAGRGQQVESCLIHWGNDARVLQHKGEMLPGIKEHGCFEGTSAMGQALALVEQEMPGFFDSGERPVNRLLVQFTDWELYGRTNVTPMIEKALAAGVNMLTVAPRDYSVRRSDLDTILRACKVKRGSTTLLKYNPMFPDQVWETAAQTLT